MSSTSEIVRAPGRLEESKDTLLMIEEHPAKTDDKDPLSRASKVQQIMPAAFLMLEETEMLTKPSYLVCFWPCC